MWLIPSLLFDHALERLGQIQRARLAERVARLVDHERGRAVLLLQVAEVQRHRREPNGTLPRRRQQIDALERPTDARAKAFAHGVHGRQQVIVGQHITKPSLDRGRLVVRQPNPDRVRDPGEHRGHGRSPSMCGAQAHHSVCVAVVGRAERSRSRRSSARARAHQPIDERVERLGVDVPRVWEGPR
jgi:hypothetical protein